MHWSIKLLCYKGSAERALGLLSEAQKTLRMALDKTKAASNVVEEVSVLMHPALLEGDLNNHENVLKLVARAKELAISCGQPIQNLVMLEGYAYCHSGKKEEALACAQHGDFLGSNNRTSRSHDNFGTILHTSRLSTS